MKTKYPLLLVLLGFLLAGCASKGTTVDPMDKRIAKSWKVSVAREGSTIVFEVGGSNNSRPGYVNFTMNLTGGGTVSFTDFDGTRFSGNWELQGTSRLILKNLNPEPTGTNGTMEFNISEFTDTSMTITRTTGSAKTGGTINVYKMTTN